MSDTNSHNHEQEDSIHLPKRQDSTSSDESTNVDEQLVPDVQPLQEHHLSEEPGTYERTPGNEGEPEILEAPEAGRKDTNRPLNEIAPSEDDFQIAMNALESIPSQSREQKEMSDQELDELASRLAAERVKSMKHVKDPFEAWEEARVDILQQMKNSNNHNSSKEA